MDTTGESSEWVVCAFPEVKRIRRDPLLATGLRAFLEKIGIARIATLSCLVICGGVNLLARRLSVDEVMIANRQTLAITLPATVLNCLFAFFLAHFHNKSLFKEQIFTFDSIYLLCNHALNSICHVLSTMSAHSDRITWDWVSPFGNVG